VVAPLVTTTCREGSVAGRPRGVGDDGRLARNFGLPFLDARVDELDAPRFHPVDGVEDAWVVVHRFVHRWGDHDRYARSQCGRGARGHRRVVDRSGDLSDRVRRRRCDEQDVGPAVDAAELDVLDAARQFRHHVASGGVLQRVGVNDPLRSPGHYRPDGRPLASELVGQFDGRDRRYRARDAEGDVHSLQH
jgi:hypothetical protein